jgi:magnesium transporter
LRLDPGSGMTDPAVHPPPSEPSTDFVGRDPERAAAASAALARGDKAALESLVKDLEAPDLADLLVLLDAEERPKLIELLGPAFDFDALPELDPTLRDELSEALPNATLARAAAELETDDAAYVIESLEDDDKADVLAQMSSSDRVALERNLEYPEETAGRLMQADFVAVPPFWSVGQVIDHMREAEDLPDSFTDIIVVDATHKVVGNIDLSRLLRSKRHVAVADIMDTERHSVLATDDQEEVARQFERYGLRSAPVVDASQRLVGVVTVDDVVEVIEKEADEDVKRLAGVGDESLSDSVKDVAVLRFWWLFVNLLTAIFASAVIKRFDATIEQMVALAVLMPIVASMGGNAGTQTMTVAVRALATQNLTAANIPRFVWRESAVGLLNGLAFALIMGAVAIAWFGSGPLGLVMAAAMVINLLAAALAGIIVPIALDRSGFDPAVSSTVFVTTVTDVVGFLAFLGLAALWLT